MLFLRRTSRFFALPSSSVLAAFVAISLCLLLAACGGERRNVFPPRASIQQLSVNADGSWAIKLRLQNFSNISMTLASVNGKLQMAGADAGALSVNPGLRIGPESAEVIDVAVSAPNAARAAFAAGGNVSYTLVGRISTSDPRGDTPYDFSGQLSPVPGLPGVFR